jgi:hypothetical protein
VKDFNNSLVSADTITMHAAPSMPTACNLEISLIIFSAISYINKRKINEKSIQKIFLKKTRNDQNVLAIFKRRKGDIKAIDAKATLGMEVQNKRLKATVDHSNQNNWTLARQ